ncbi:MAG: ATP-binding protein [Actinocrinis sp.]
MPRLTGRHAVAATTCSHLGILFDTAASRSVGSPPRAGDTGPGRNYPSTGPRLLRSFGRVSVGANPSYEPGHGDRYSGNVNLRAAGDEQQHAVSRTTRPRLPRVGAPRFVGREAELARVVGALARPPALVLVEGEAGIGKSRLVREALAALSPAPELASAPGSVPFSPLVAVCPPFREPLTLGPIVDAARQRTSEVSGLGLSALAGTLRPLFPEWADTLPPAPESLADPGAARHRLIRALAELLDRLGVSVLVVEDVHWADEATMDFLLFLASRRPQRIGLLLTYRAEDLPGDSLLPRLSAFGASGACGGLARVTLGGLEPPQVAQLVSSMLDDERVSPAFAGLLHSRTEGVPLALEESVRLLHDRSDLIRRDGEWIRKTLDEIDVPPSIRDAVTERVGRLGADAQRILLAAAVLVDPETEDVLARVSGLPAASAWVALREAALSGLVAEDHLGRIAFRHVLAARAVYDRAAGSDRRAAHSRAAAALEPQRPTPVARLAYHHRAAQETALWCRYAEQAADLALATGDHPTAVGLLHELLTSGGLPAGDVARIAQKMPVLTFTGYLRRVDVISTLRTVLDDPRLSRSDRGRIRGQLGRMLMHVGEYAAGTEEIQRAIPDLADRPIEAARALSTLGGPVGSLWPASEHRRWLDRAAQVVESAGAAIPEGERQILTIDRITALLDLAEQSGWDLAAAFPASDESVPQEALNLARLSLNTGNAAMQWGHLQDARRRLAIAGDVARRHRYQRLRDMTLVTLMHLDWFTGSWGGLAERLRHWARLDDEPLMQLDSRLVLGLLGAAVGDDPAAEDNVRAVRDESTRRGIADMSMESTGALARLRLAAGDVDEALSLTDDAVQVVAGKGMWLWATETVPVRVAALTAAKCGGEAEDLVATFARGLGERPIPSAHASLATCRALLADGRADYAEAAHAWDAAAVAWQALPRPYYALLAREQKARSLLKIGETDAALSQWAETARGLASLGAKQDADRVARTLTRHGGRPPGPRKAGRRGYGDQLSPREQEVVELLLSGLTNREIAIALSRSPKTVAAQLNSAMRKHGVTTRTALAVVVTQTRYAPTTESAPE